MKLYKGNIMEVINENVEAISEPFSGVIFQSYECIICKDSVDLIKLPNHHYVYKEDVRNKLDLLWLNFCAKHVDAIEQMLFFDKRIMGNAPCFIGKYVDENSLEEISLIPRFAKNK